MADITVSDVAAATGTPDVAAATGSQTAGTTGAASVADNGYTLSDQSLEVTETGAPPVVVLVQEVERTNVASTSIVSLQGMETAFGHEQMGFVRRDEASEGLHVSRIARIAMVSN